MKTECSEISIKLNQKEICDLWNIIMFALDWQNSELTKEKPKMNDCELKLANDLCDILDKLK